MARTFSICFTFFVFILVSIKGASADGKKLFTDNKCNKCHSVKSDGIEPLPSSLKEKKEITDLSSVGIKRDAEWLKKFQKKEIANEEGKKHKEKWKGTDEDLEQIVNWLITLKTKIDEAEIKKWYDELRQKAK